MVIRGSIKRIQDGVPMETKTYQGRFNRAKIISEWVKKFGTIEVQILPDTGNKAIWIDRDYQTPGINDLNRAQRILG